MNLAKLRKHSVTLAGHRTSLSLEEAFWQRLKHEAEAQGRPLAELLAEIDRGRQGNLSSAVRVYLLARLEAASQDSEKPPKVTP